MAGLYSRVTARGFPSNADAGYTGEGALWSQGGPADPAHGESSGGYGQPPSQLPGMPVGSVADVQLEISEINFYVPGELLDPSQAPGYGPGDLRTHAGPVPGHAGSTTGMYDPNYNQDLAVLHRNSAEIHAQDFGSPKLQDFRGRVPPGSQVLPMDPWESNAPELTGPETQVPLTGGQRVLGGIDAVQGYDRRNRYGFDAGHKYRPGISGNVVNAYLEPAERPFIVPQGSGTYIPTDEVQGPDIWYGYNGAENINYHDPSAYTPTPEPATLSQPLVEASAWGW